MYYDIIKSLHLIFVISWMVGLLYLPRLFVYHSNTKYNSKMDKTFLVMESRLLKIIMNPSIIVTYVFGLLLLFDSSYLLYEIYFIIKIVFIILLSLFHLYLSILYKSFKKGYRYNSPNFYRKINEIPTVLMISIILLIVIKPDLN